MPLKKKIRIKEVPLPDRRLGDCSKDGDTYRIRINPNHYSERSRLNTAIHEALHAADWDGLSEKRIRTLTAYVVEVLWREGYRRVLQ
jgi:hypothetical protein